MSSFKIVGLPFTFKCDWSACNVSIAKMTSTKKNWSLDQL